MKTVNKKYLYWAISLVFIGGILISIYAILGGFDKIQLAQSNNNVYSIAGKYVQGHRMHIEEGKIFKEVRDLIQSEKIKGELCMIDYESDTLESDEINRFIGVLLDDEITAIPSKFQVIALTSARSYKAALTMHPLVMPNTDKVKQALVDYAALQQDSLQDLSLEVYYTDNSVLVERFAK